MLIATAGHVDHGKTALVGALTGVDTDRLPEEKKRGLTIDLGFAYRSVGAGQRLGFVDVPGHERFVRNMLSGVAAIDLALLVIAADDGVMPQTREHFAILSLLGVKNIVVAISKIDAADDARIAQVETEAKTLLAGAPPVDYAFFRVSALSGEGIAELSSYLYSHVESLRKRSAEGHFRLAVDRCFSVTGAGLVVTGAVFSGVVQTGDQLRLSPGGKNVRVRAIHSQGEAADSGRAGERCALNIAGAGLSLETVQRGDWLLSPQLDVLCERLDVYFYLLPGEQHALKHWTPVHVHAGSGSATGRVALLEGKTLAPGVGALAQLVLDKPVSLVFGDRFVVRDQSAQRTLGGGHIIDPYGLKRGRAKPERLALLKTIDRDDPHEVLQTLLDDAPDGVDPRRFANSRNLTAAQTEALFEHMAVVRLDGAANQPALALAASRWEALRSAILQTLNDWHDQHPDSVGPNAQQIRPALAVAESHRVFMAAMQRLVRDAEIMRQGVFLHLPGHQARLSESDQAVLGKVREYLRAEELKPPALKDLASLLGEEREQLEVFLDRFARRGLITRISASRYFHPLAVEQLARICVQLMQSDPEGFSVRAFRDAARIGRNATVEILEYFDSIGFTRRVGDRRWINPQHRFFGMR